MSRVTDERYEQLLQWAFHPTASAWIAELADGFKAERTALEASEARVRELEQCAHIVDQIHDERLAKLDAAESRLADLLEGLEGLVAKWRSAVRKGDIDGN